MNVFEIICHADIFHDLNSFWELLNSGIKLTDQVEQRGMPQQSTAAPGDARDEKQAPRYSKNKIVQCAVYNLQFQETYKLQLRFVLLQRYAHSIAIVENHHIE